MDVGLVTILFVPVWISLCLVGTIAALGLIRVCAEEIPSMWVYHKDDLFMKIIVLVLILAVLVTVLAVVMMWMWLLALIGVL